MAPSIITVAVIHFQCNGLILSLLSSKTGHGQGLQLCDSSSIPHFDEVEPKHERFTSWFQIRCGSWFEMEVQPPLSPNKLENIEPQI